MLVLQFTYIFNFEYVNEVWIRSVLGGKVTNLTDFVVYLGNSTTFLNVHIIHKKGSWSQGGWWDYSPPDFGKGKIFFPISTHHIYYLLPTPEFSNLPTALIKRAPLVRIAGTIVRILMLPSDNTEDLYRQTDQHLWRSFPR